MKFRLYKDKAGEYRWTFKADNGEPMADSGEGYTRKASCVAAITTFKSKVNQASIDDETNEP